ncbi:MAG TPA: hypothetical protein VGB83_07515 [Actinomycetota bacterium]
MRRVVLILALVAACRSPAAPPAPGDPVRFRAISEKLNPAPCTDGPSFMAAPSESRWIDVFDRQTACLPGAKVRLPTVDFRRFVGVAAWWGRRGCAGDGVRTQRVEYRDGEVTVTATASDACASPTGALESFLAIRRPGPPITTIRFVLDGQELGRAVI